MIETVFNSLFWMACMLVCFAMVGIPTATIAHSIWKDRKKHEKLPFLFAPRIALFGLVVLLSMYFSRGFLPLPTKFSTMPWPSVIGCAVFVGINWMVMIAGMLTALPVHKSGEKQNSQTSDHDLALSRSLSKDSGRSLPYSGGGSRAHPHFLSVWFIPDENDSFSVYGYVPINPSLNNDGIALYGTGTGKCVHLDKLPKNAEWRPDESKTESEVIEDIHHGLKYQTIDCLVYDSRWLVQRALAVQIIREIEKGERGKWVNLHVKQYLPLFENHSDKMVRDQWQKIALICGAGVLSKNE